MTTLNPKKANQKRYTSKLIPSLHNLLSAKEILVFHHIRRTHLQYFLAFPLTMVFINIQNFILSDGERLFGLSRTTVAFLSFSLGASLLFLFTTQKNIAFVSRLSAIITTLGFIPWLFASSGKLGFVFAIILMFGVGGCVSSSSFSFVFILNNAERFFGCALLILLIDVAELCFEYIHVPPLISKVFALILISILCASMYLTHRKDFESVVNKNILKIDSSIWLVLFIFLSYFAIRISGFYAEAFQHPSNALGWGILASVIILLSIVIQVVLKSSAWTMCNLFFMTAILSHVMWYVHLPKVAYMFSEVKEVGLLIALYLIGCVTNKFCDFRIHKFLILLCMASIGLLVLGIDFLNAMMLTQTIAVLTATGLFIVFLMLSPVFSQRLFFADWSKEFRQIHMTNSSLENTNHRLSLDETNLSPREKQVVSLLLRGMTLRQVAPELGLTVSTVATYSKTIYKKLGINSRAELFLLFDYPQYMESIQTDEL